jgi:hypothetical protein
LPKLSVQGKVKDRGKVGKVVKVVKAAVNLAVDSADSDSAVLESVVWRCCALTP